MIERNWLTMCWLESHLRTASCSSSRTSGGTVPISLVFLMSNVLFRKRYKSSRWASSSVDTNENAVPCRPALAQRPEIRILGLFSSQKPFKIAISERLLPGFDIKTETVDNELTNFRVFTILTDSMDKQLWFAWEMNVDHVVQLWNIDTTGRDIRYN